MDNNIVIPANGEVLVRFRDWCKHSLDISTHRIVGWRASVNPTPYDDHAEPVMANANWIAGSDKIAYGVIELCNNMETDRNNIGSVVAYPIGDTLYVDVSEARVGEAAPIPLSTFIARVTRELEDSRAEQEVDA